jgi:hypothetical protein
MKLLKSTAGRALIILYYVLFLGTAVFIMIFIMIKTGSLLLGLGIGFVLSIGIGVLGGELEFLEHRKVKYGKRFKERTAGETDKLLTFR